MLTPKTGDYWTSKTKPIIKDNTKYLKIILINNKGKLEWLLYTANKNGDLTFSTKMKNQEAVNEIVKDHKSRGITVRFESDRSIEMKNQLLDFMENMNNEGNNSAMNTDNSDDQPILNNEKSNKNYNNKYNKALYIRI
eukprot:110004_1